MSPGPRAASTVFRTMSAQWRLVALTASKSNCQTRQNTAGKAEAPLQNLLEAFPLHNRNRSISIPNGRQNLAEVSSLLFSQRRGSQMRGNLSHAALERLPLCAKGSRLLGGSNDRRRPSGVMQADEICFPLFFKGGGDPEVKPPRRIGQKKGGLFGEPVCISCALDPDRRVVARAAKLGKYSAVGPAGGFCRQDRRRPRKRFRRRSLLQKVLRTKRIQACRIARGKEQKSARHPSHQQPPSGLRQCINGRFHGAATKYLSHCIAWRNPIRLNMGKSVKEQRI